MSEMEVQRTGYTESVKHAREILERAIANNQNFIVVTMHLDHDADCECIVSDTAVLVGHPEEKRRSKAKRKAATVLLKLSRMLADQVKY
jgi:hypothetical protein